MKTPYPCGGSHPEGRGRGAFPGRAYHERRRYFLAWDSRAFRANRGGRPLSRGRGRGAFKAYRFAQPPHPGLSGSDGRLRAGRGEARGGGNRRRAQAGAAARDSLWRQGHHRHKGRADDARVELLPGQNTRGGRGVRRPPQARRRDSDGEMPYPGVRLRAAEHQRALRHRAQSVGPRAHDGRLEHGVGRLGRRRPLPGRHRDGHGQFDPRDLRRCAGSWG